MKHLILISILSLCISCVQREEQNEVQDINNQKYIKIGNENLSNGEFYEMEEIILQRPPLYAHLGDSVIVRHFKLLVNEKDTIRQEIDSLSVPAHFRKRYTESFISLIYKSKIPWNGTLNMQNAQNVKIRLQIVDINKYSLVDAKLVMPNQRILQYLFSIAKENPDTYPYQSSYETEMLLPLQIKGYFIIIAYMNTKAFYSIEPVVLESLTHKTINLKEIDEDDLRQKLKILLNPK